MRCILPWFLLALLLGLLWCPEPQPDRRRQYTGPTRPHIVKQHVDQPQAIIFDDGAPI